MIDPPQGIEAYASGVASFAVGLHPPIALAMSWADTLDVLRERFGATVDTALSEEASDPRRSISELPPEVRSPRAADRDPSWLRRTNMVGINVRTVSDYAGVIKYSLTLPAMFDSIHLLPIWEPGAVGSLYGIAGWNLNTEFVSSEMRALAPHLDSAARQLRACSNLLHVMGKTVGMDVIPHTDRFSEPALADPDLFEWMRVADRQIVESSPAVTRRVERAIVEWIGEHGTADGSARPTDVTELYRLDEADRAAMLFGAPDDRDGRIERRVGLLRHLKSVGLEPVPATMGVPFRGVMVDPDPDHTVVDDGGLDWPDYVIAEPQPMSRVFSPLARFKLYENVSDDSWEIDFDRPRTDVWAYICEHYAAAQRIGNFDFMRGDMAHVQMRPDGVPAEIDDYYDILGAVKHHIAQTAPWFGSYAETFLPARDVFQFGEELDHLEASDADATLGDLQSTVVGSRPFLRNFRRYLDDLATRRTAPSFTVMTADKDDPRFDEFYRAGNEVRMFTAMFMPDMPTYTALGFELRDVRHEPVENERYTKLFVFHESGDSNVYPSKARFSVDYLWGSNTDLFDGLTRLRTFAERLEPSIAGGTTRWLIAPDATGLRATAAWTVDAVPSGADQFVFVVNYDLDAASGYFGLPALPGDVALIPVFSTGTSAIADESPIVHNGVFHRIDDLDPAEGRIYRVRNDPR